jgi:hypothetical protein
MIPNTNAARLPTAAASSSSGASTAERVSSRTAAPAIATAPSRNENSAAASGFTPSASAAEMVEPLREIPGTSAKACAQPIQKAAA